MNSSETTIEQVMKRSLSYQPFSGDKIKKRLFRLTFNTDQNQAMNLVDVNRIYFASLDKMKNNMTTVELDSLLVETCLSLAVSDKIQQYNVIAARIVIECNHRTYEKDLSVFVKKAMSQKNMFYFHDALVFIGENMKELSNIVQHSRDFLYSYETLEKNNKFGRFQFVLLLLIVNDILTNWHCDSSSVLPMVKSMYNKVSESDKEVTLCYKELPKELFC